MKKTRILTLLLAFVLTISPLAVFGTDNGSAADDAAAQDAVLAVDAADADAYAEQDAAEEDILYSQNEAEEDVILYAAASNTVTPGAWNDDRTQYIGTDGSPVKGLFLAKMIDGSTVGLYHADASGNVSGYKESGTMVRVSSGTKYKYDEDSKVWVEASDSGTLVYYIQNQLDPCIVHKAGVYDSGSSKYFVSSYGTVRVKEGVVSDGTNKYYVEAGGTVQTSAGFIEHTTSSGDRRVYYVQSGGKIRTKLGTFSVGNNIYLIKSSKGYIESTKGFVTYDSHKYYVSDKHGVLAKDKTITVKKKKYHVSAKAVVQTGLHTWNSTKYLANDNGALYTKGIRTYGKKRYYVTNDYGKVAIQKKIKVSGKTYFASKDAHLLTGVIKWYDGKYYYCYDNSVMMTKSAVFKTDGKWYCNKSGGGLRTSAMITYNYKHYYAGSSAHFLTSSFKYNGYTISPNSSTGEISFTDWNKIHGNKWTQKEYIQISISKQSLVYYYNGEKLTSCSIISGTAGVNDSRKGKFKIQKKLTNQKATFGGKSFNIVYWMNYSSDGDKHMAIGDTPYWISKYGGSIYKTAGSDGEIIVPYNSAKTIYNNAPVGTTIYIK